MHELSSTTLATVCGGETFADLKRAVGPALNVPLSGTYAATQKFIADHPFFHEGLMDKSIGFGKHGRNIPFVGPSLILKGIDQLDLTMIRKGWRVTKATWQAP